MMMWLFTEMFPFPSCIHIFPISRHTLNKWSKWFHSNFQMCFNINISFSGMEKVKSFWRLRCEGIAVEWIQKHFELNFIRQIVIMSSSSWADGVTIFDSYNIHNRITHTHSYSYGVEFIWNSAGIRRKSERP